MNEQNEVIGLDQIQHVTFNPNINTVVSINRNSASIATWNISWAPCETLPVPVNTNVKGPMDLGIIPVAISYPASLTACLAIPVLR